MLCRICAAVHIQPRKHLLGHADSTTPTRQHELHPTDHTDQKTIRLESARSLDYVGFDYLSVVCKMLGSFLPVKKGQGKDTRGSGTEPTILRGLFLEKLKGHFSCKTEKKLPTYDVPDNY